MEKFTFFWAGPFSQWCPSTFTMGSNTFSCAEQAMMYGKAILFRDLQTALKIMETTSPPEQKALGRKVRDFMPDVWNNHCKDIVYRANYAKFTQNPQFLNSLLATEGTTLVEASPYDRIWGIGLEEDDPRAKNRARWLGTNWLGEVLTKVRDDIMAGKTVAR